ncbi:MAG: efflux RND transporter periplasmic adaptor subunit [Runella sp.]
MKNIIALTGLVLLLITSCQHHEKESNEEITLPVTKIIKKDTTFNKEYVCQIRAIQHIELRALEKGYLQKIYVDEGQRVRKGQLLFQIMPLVYNAEAQKAQAEVNFAETEYRNTKQLADSNIVSKNELALIKAKLDKAKAELSLAQAHLGFTEIRAPFDGIVGRFNDVRLGSLVDEGALLTTLSDNSKMWVYFNVPETEYLDYSNRAKAGNKVAVQLQMANHQLFDQQGIIETIEADFNNETGNIAFRATFSNPQNILRHGETGNILMPVSLKNALLVPQKATFEILEKKFVYVVGNDGTLRLQEVNIATEMPHLYATVSGLKEGEMVLVDGLRKVKNGQKIHFTNASLQDVLQDLAHLHAE